MKVTLGYRFAAVYQAPAAFASSWARLSGVPISTSGSRNDFTLSSTYETALASFDARGTGLGGWTLSDHHTYDPQSRTVVLGDGGFAGVAAKRLGALEPLAATGFDGPTAIAAAPDGSFWVADTRTQRIRRVDTAGAVTTVAGVPGAYGYRAADEGALATAARLSSPQGITIHDRETYIADTGANRIRHIDASGRIRTVAGGGTALGDNGPATSARLSGPTGVAVAPDGSLAIADTNQHRVRLVGTDGTITTLAGDGTPGASGDGGRASAARLRGPAAVAYDADGRLLIADAGNSRVRRVGIDGRIETLPVNGLSEPTGLDVGLDGTIFIADAGGRRHPRPRGRRQHAHDRRRRQRAARRGRAVERDHAGRADRRRGPRRRHVRLHRAGRPIACPRSPSRSRASATATRWSAPADGSQIFQFDPSGRHQRTLDALTGAVLRRFTYDSEGRLGGDVRRRARRALAAADDRAPERDDDPADGPRQPHDDADARRGRLARVRHRPERACHIR